MATSGSTSVAIFGNNQLNLVFKWWVNSDGQSIADNTTLVYWEMQLKSGSAGHLDSSASKDYSVTVDGKTWSGKNTVGIANDTTKKLASGSKTINHNTNGTKEFSYSFSQAINITRQSTGAWVGTFTGDGTGELDTIPRASSIANISGSTIGSSVTVSITPASSAFTHKVYYKAPNTASNVLKATLAAGTKSTSFTPPLSDCNNIPNATSGTATITLETYSGSTLLGTVTKTFTLNVPSSVKPSISALTVADGVAGIPTKFGAFVKTKSKAQVSITAAGSYSSTIKSYTTTLTSGSTVLTYNGANFTSSVLSIAGTLTIKTIVTDSRGRTAETSKTYNVLDYHPPEIKSFIAYRVDDDLEKDDEGEVVCLDTVYKVSPLGNKNDVIATLEYRESGTSTWTVIYDKAPLANPFNGEWIYEFTAAEPMWSVVDEVVFSTDKAYELRITIQDYFTSATRRAEVPTARTIFDILADGTGICFGGVASQSNTCEIVMQSHFKGGQKNLYATDETNLNEFTTPNIYVSKNLAAGTYANIPDGVTRTFTLEVMSAGQEGQLLQRLTTCSQNYPDIRTRHYYGGTWGDWQRVGGVANIMTAHLSADTNTVANAYTKISLAQEYKIGAGLSISDGAIKIGAGIKAVKVSANVEFSVKGAGGNKHIRIKKGTGDNYIAWAANSGVTGKIQLITIPSKVISVSKDDLISLYYYSSAADDVINAGSSAGYKTFLTVEVVA